MAAAGTWSVYSGHGTQLLVEGKADHRYRIASSASSNVDAYLNVDKVESTLRPGEYRDIVGKRIEVILKSNNGKAVATGTYDNLD